MADEKWEVVTTDNRSWHSQQITGIVVWDTEKKAREYLARIRRNFNANQGGFIRKAQT